MRFSSSVQISIFTILLAVHPTWLHAEQSDDELLKRASDLLETKQAEHKQISPAKKKVSHHEDRVEGLKESSDSPPLGEPTSPQKTVETKQPEQKPTTSAAISPEESARLSKILNVESHVLVVERNRSVQDFGLRLGGGAATLVHQSLIKDDDSFDAVSGSRLYGGELEAELASWDLTATQTRPPQLALGLGLGLYEATIPIQRSGVEHGLEEYDRQLFSPVGFLELRQRYYLLLQPFIQTGASVDIIRQNGLADYDTELDVGIHDYVQIGNRFQFINDSAFRVYCSYSWHGTGLINPRSKYFYMTAIAGVEWKIGHVNPAPAQTISMQANETRHVF